MKFLRKRLTVGFLGVITALGVMTASWASALPEDHRPSTVSVEVSFFSQLEEQEIVSPVSVTIPVKEWDQALFETLRQDGVLEAYQYRSGRLRSITVSGKVYAASSREPRSYWDFTVNQTPISLSEYSITEGDKIRWVLTQGTLAPDVSSDMGSGASSDSSQVESVLDSSLVSSSGAKTSSQEISSVAESSLSSAASVSSAVSSQPERKPSNPNQYQWDNTLASALDQACAWLKRNTPGEFYLTALGAAGKSADTRAVDQYMHTISEKNGNYTNVLELEKNILSATFSGLNANDVRGSRLIHQLASFENLKDSGASGAAYGLLALDSNNYEVPAFSVNSRSSLRKDILSFQQEDGGFSADGKAASDVETTALCLTALAPYRNHSGILKSLQQGIGYLSNAQTENGQFLASGAASSQTLSQVIVSLNALELNMNDPRFLKGEKNIVDLLLEYQQSDGGFSIGRNSGTGSDISATEQAVLALVALKNGMSPYRTNYSSGSGQSTEQKNGVNLLFYGIIVVFGLLLLTAAAGFVYFKIKHRKDDKEEFSELEEQENPPKTDPPETE